MIEFDRGALLAQGLIDLGDLVAHDCFPRAFIEALGLVRPRHRPRAPIDLRQRVHAGRGPAVSRRPFSDQACTVGFDLRGPTRQRAHGSGQLSDLAVDPDRVAVAGQRCDPLRIGARSKLTFGIHNGVQLHRDSGVDVRPPAVGAEHLHVEPQMTMDVRVKRARTAVLQLDNLEPGAVFADEPVVSTSGIELPLPGEEHLVSQPVLQRFELSCEPRMQKRGDAVGLRVIDRPVEHQVSVGTQPLTASFLPRDRIVAGQPYAESTGGQLVARDGTVLHDESRYGRT